MKSGIVLLIIGVLTFAIAGSSFAEDNSPLVKFKNGLVNVITSPVEIPKQIGQTYGDSDNMFEAMTIGMIKGVLYCAGRAIAGAVDTAFFFIPPYDKPLVEPLYQI